MPCSIRLQRRKERNCEFSRLPPRLWRALLVARVLRVTKLTTLRFTREAGERPGRSSPCCYPMPLRDGEPELPVLPNLTRIWSRHRQRTLAPLVKGVGSHLLANTAEEFFGDPAGVRRTTTCIGTIKPRSCADSSPGDWWAVVVEDCFRSPPLSLTVARAHVVDAGTP